MTDTKAPPAHLQSSHWVWMPHPGHFICGRDCRFHLNTYVGGYIVSTVGEYLPDSKVREIMAESRGIKLEGKGDAREADFMRKCGYVEIGLDRLYETMVFRAMPTDDVCCPWWMANGSELAFAGYNESGAARLGHLELCAKWSCSNADAAEPPPDSEKDNK